MIKHYDLQIESEPVPSDVGLVNSVDGKTFEVSTDFVPPVYPPVRTFDIDVLSARGITPNAVSSLIEPTIDSIENGMDIIDYNTKEL